MISFGISLAPPQQRGAGGSRRRLLRSIGRWRSRSARSCTLGGGIHRVERLARGHEQPVALGAAEADVAAHLGQADPADQLAVRRPYRHAAITHVAAGIARSPDIAVATAAHAIRSALHAVNHEVAEPLLIGELVVDADIEHEHVALAAGTSIAWPFAGTDDVQLLVIGREPEAVGIRHLILAHHEVEAAAGIDPIAVGRELAFARHEAGRLPDPWIELAGQIA